MTPSTTIDDREALASTPARETALACIEAGIEAARPQQILENQLGLDGESLRVGEGRYDLGEFDEVVVIGGGKAAAGVASTLGEVLGERVSGAVVAPVNGRQEGAISVLPGDHPIPSKRGVESTEEILEIADGTGERTLVLAVVTGGASALLAAPAEGISLADLQECTEALLESGATIDEINAVRKHCSAIKGGSLARRGAPATIVSVLLSDVVGDDPGVIGSGPTAPDGTTFADARAVLDRYGIDAVAVRERLDRGVAGGIDETPGPNSSVFDRVTNRVLAGAHTALDGARAVAEKREYQVRVLSSTLRGEARDLGLVHAAVAEESIATGEPVSPPAVVLSGGEATVTVTGNGTGGPNLELALAAAIEFETSDEQVALCSVDTDGRDGGTDVAGALVDGGTLGDYATDAREALAENDAFGPLDAATDVVRTGQTGTNVNDLRALVIESEAE